MPEQAALCQFWHEYKLEDVTDLERQLRGLLPEAKFERCDYDYAMWVTMDGRMVCACQPERRDTYPQSGVWRTAEEVKRLLCQPRDE